MSTPPFIAMPDGVVVLGPPAAPAPILLAEPGAGPAPAGGSDGAGTGTDSTGTPSGAGTSGTGTSSTGTHGTSPGGTGTSTPPARGDVLLVPGFTGSKEDFIALLRPLADLGWRVAAMDLPGQAGSPGLGPRGAHTLDGLARAVLAVADWLAPDRPVHLVGHSMGGLVIRELLIAHPRRMASWTALSSGPGPVAAGTHPVLRQLQAMLSRLPMEQVWVHKEAADRAAGWDPPTEIADFCARRFIANDPAALADMADILMTAPDRTDQAASALEAAGIAGAVVTGAMDDAWPVAQQQDMAGRLRVPWQVIDGAGHNPAVEDPAATATVLDSTFAAASVDRAERQA